MTPMPEPPRTRNHVIDLARVASVIVVVVFHGLLYQVRLVDGAPVVVPWAAPVGLYPLTWVLMIMPLFFVAGGFGHTLTVDRLRREGASYAYYLASRGRRLVGPVAVFVTFCAVVATAAAWLGPLDEVAELGRQVMQLLWFITVYLVIVAIAPAMVSAHDRYGIAPMLALGALAAGVDAWSFAVGDAQLRNLNMLTVWPLVHQLGIAYERGWFRRGPAWTAWACVAGGAAGVAVLVFGFGYPPTAVGFADLPIANIQPPTLAMAVLAVAQCGALGLLERSGVGASLPPRFARVVAVGNALSVGVYLWHIGCILLAGGLLLGLALAVPAASGFLLHQLTVAAVSLVVVAVVVPLLGRLELRLVPPLGGRPDGPLAVVAYAVLAASTLLVWQFGVVLHPMRPGSTLGVIGIWVGSWLMARAAAPSERPVLS